MIEITATFKLEKESSEFISKSFIKNHTSGKTLTEISGEIGELFAFLNALIKLCYEFSYLKERIKNKNILYKNFNLLKGTEN